MITEGLRRVIDELRHEGGCAVYIVEEISPNAVLALVVPKGGENGETVNPLGGGCAHHVTLPATDTDWGRVSRPILMMIDDSGPPPRGQPTLHIVA